MEPSSSPMNTVALSVNDVEMAQHPIPQTWIKVEFSLFLVGQIFATPCYLFVMYHILMHKHARRALHNHVIICLLIYNLIDLTIDLSLTMSYSISAHVSLFSPALCLLWQFVDYGIWYGSISLMFWASVERHILVFHSNLVCTLRRRLLVHYLPLLFFCLYTPVLYFYLTFLHPCEPIYDSATIRCGTLCYLTIASPWFIYYDTLAHYTIPILLIAFSSGALVFRFLRQRSRLKQAVKWRQCRKMIIQLALVSVSYLVFDLPYIIIVIVQSSGCTKCASEWITPYIAHLVYVPAIIVPFATMLSLPRLKHKLRALLFWRQIRRTVAPLTVIQ